MILPDNRTVRQICTFLCLPSPRPLGTVTFQILLWLNKSSILLWCISKSYLSPISSFIQCSIKNDQSYATVYTAMLAVIIRTEKCSIFSKPNFQMHPLCATEKEAILCREVSFWMCGIWITLTGEMGLWKWDSETHIISAQPGGEQYAWVCVFNTLE